METKTAYCKHCGKNTAVSYSMPPKGKNILTMVLLLICLPGVGILIALWLFLWPGNSLYCSECGSWLGYKSNVKAKCVYCDTELDPEAAFCPKCGKKNKVSKDSAVCRKCKAENPSDFKFCAKCGTKLPVTSANRGRSKKDDKPAEYGWRDWE